MPVPESRLYNSEQLNRWFAVASILMTASFFWMIYVDYARPWRDFQDNYYVGKAALAHLDYLDAMREDNQDEIKRVRQRQTDAEALFDQSGAAEVERLDVELIEADLAFRKANGPWSRADQVLEVTRDKYERSLGRHGPSHSKTSAAHQQLRDEEDELEVMRKEKEKWEDAVRDLEKRIRTLKEPVRMASKKLADLEQIAADAARKDREYRGVLQDDGLLGGVPVVSALINMPLLDFTAPKNTPARHQVNQLVLYDVRQRLNYLESYTTDRCTTCHVGINDREFSPERLAVKLEQSIPAINEAMLKLGHDPLDFPDPPEIGGVALPTGRVTERWGELTDVQRDAYFDGLLERVNSYFKLTGRKSIGLAQPILAHPDLDLYVSVDSPHPMQQIGCTVCHEGNPQETDFILAAHSPPTHEIEEEWRERYYDRVMGIPTMTFETISHYWDRPMRLPKHTEAGCAKCHSEITDIAQFGGERKGSRINLGRHLFVNVGCINCHNVDQLKDSRRVGPELTRVASKLKPEFVQQWVYFPQKFRPSTRMPHFFMQENNRAQSANSFDPDPVMRTETEVAAVTKYLFTVSRAFEPIARPDGVEGNVDRGRELFTTVGCLACHANVTEFGEQWITEDMLHRNQDLTEQQASYRYKGMTYDQRVRYAMEHFVNERDTFLHPDLARFDPDAEYNTPTFTRFAPELSGIGSKVTFDWLYSWLIEPTHYAPDTIMPSFRLSPGEAADVAAYLLTLKHEGFKKFEFEMEGARASMADELMFTLLVAQRSERRARAIMNDVGGELTDTLVALMQSSFGIQIAKQRGLSGDLDGKTIAALGKQVAYDLIQPMTLDEKKLFYLGNKTISHYGCYACHEIPGFETATPPGTDLSGWTEKPVSQLDFAFYNHAFHDMRHEKEEEFGYVYPRDAELLNHLSPTPDDMREQITHTHAAFAKHKMLNPRIWDREKLKRPYDKLKMPNYYFTERESDALTAYLLSRMPARVNDNLKVDYDNTTLGPIAKGRNLTRELNCVGCHEIEDNVPTVQQYFRREISGELDFDTSNAPPSLRGEGAKLQHNWFHRFLQQVEPLRPWLEVRMPSFNLTGDQATTLVQYFAALSRDDSDRLADAMAPVDEFLRQNKNSADQETPNWWEDERIKPRAEQLRRWAIERNLIRERDLDQFSRSKERVRAGHERLLERVRFLQKLYDVEYPFVEPPSQLSSRDRFDRGMRFLDDMGCLKCHVLGDMMPGPATSTDEFVQIYRLDGVRGDGDSAIVILNGQPHPVGSVVDGYTIISGSNTYNDTGDVDTKAIVEGPGPTGETEQVLLVAASAPNLSLTYERLRREWVVKWMLEPQWIQPGTKMPQNFAGGVSPYEGDPEYPGSGMDHIELLVDALFDAGRTSARVPLLKISVVDTAGEFDEEDGEFDEEEDFDD